VYTAVKSRMGVGFLLVVLPVRHFFLAREHLAFVVIVRPS